MNDRVASGPKNEQQSTKRARVRGTPKGRSVDPKAREEVRALLKDAPLRRDLLIEHLHRIQDRYGHLSAAHLVALADHMKLSMTEVYEVATFYHHFDVIKEGETAPAAVVGQNPLPHASVEKIAALVKANALKHPAPGSAGSHPHGEIVSPDYVDYAAYRAKGGYALAKSCIDGAKKREDVIAVMENSGLRGLGGAGFPAGRKWKSVAAEPAPRLMAINIDEGEPGTFKDRWYLERDPHRFVEGALVAAWAVGIDEIYIYLRDEYHGCRAILEKEIAALQKSPPCELPPIYLRRGAGAYICGEESAMIESIEGKRGMPRLRPPYVAQVGLFNRPTLEHNMETLHWVRQIVEQGAAWFVGHGRNGRKGLRSFSVSGRVKRPGVHLAPAGITVRELIAEYCGGMLDGHQFYAYLPGGASGGILPATKGDLPLDFDTLQPYGSFIGSAAVVILSQRDSAAAAAANLMKFFHEESCGKCTPCRVGTAKALALMGERRWNQPLLNELSQTMMDASICGLGQAAPNPALTVMKYFPQEVQ